MDQFLNTIYQNSHNGDIDKQWRNIPCSCVGRLNTVKCQLFPSSCTDSTKSQLKCQQAIL